MKRRQENRERRARMIFSLNNQNNATVYHKDPVLIRNIDKLVQYNNDLDNEMNELIESLDNFNEYIFPNTSEEVLRKVLLQSETTYSLKIMLKSAETELHQLQKDINILQETADDLKSSSDKTNKRIPKRKLLESEKLKHDEEQLISQKSQEYEYLNKLLGNIYRGLSAMMNRYKTEICDIGREIENVKKNNLCEPILVYIHIFIYIYRLVLRYLIKYLHFYHQNLIL